MLLLDIAVLTLHYFSSLQNWESTYRELKTFLFQLVLWELILLIAVSYVFYQLLNRYTRYKEEATEFQNLLIQATSHKMGNFLATQKVDLQLVKETGSKNALDRLENGYAFLERDFRHILRLIREYEFEQPKREILDLASITEKMLRQFSSEVNSQLRYRIQKTEIKASLPEVENIVFLLLDNATRYSCSKIYIRCGEYNKKSYLFIANDVQKTSAQGTGMGLSIAERMCSRNNLQLLTRLQRGHYSVLLAEKNNNPRDCLAAIKRLTIKQYASYSSLCF